MKPQRLFLHIYAVSVAAAILLGGGCATYYQKSVEFQKHFVHGDLTAAEAVLSKNTKAGRGKDRLLYFFQQGVVQQMLGNYQKSNEYLEKAYIFSEDYQKNMALEAISLLTNPAVKPYQGEDFEIVLIHYYKALNFLRMRQFEEALVECRRINLRINSINDRYKDHKNRYKTDAFALVLMGIIFEASGELNDAFIAYRNALEAYQDVYLPSFGVAPPEQLIDDLMRTAYLNGFREELQLYEQQFGRTYQHTPKKGGEVVFFWNNGLGPVKDEWSINFSIIRGDRGWVSFVNRDFNLTFPYYMEGKDNDDSILNNLKFIRIAFPRYLERQPVYHRATLLAGGRRYPLQLAQDINSLAIKSLEDRMTREFATSLLRFALKQAGEEIVRKKNKSLGTLLSIVNAISEKADTRNWQTLPYEIAYARVPLAAGKQTLTLRCQADGPNTDSEHTFDFDIREGGTQFFMFHSLESYPLRPN